MNTNKIGAGLLVIVTLLPLGAVFAETVDTTGTVQSSSAMAETEQMNRDKKMLDKGMMTKEKMTQKKMTKKEKEKVKQDMMKKSKMEKKVLEQKMKEQKQKEMMSNELKDAHSKSGEEAKKMGSYISVAPADVMAKIASLPASDTKVLFFHASWCATCAATDKSFTEKGIQRAGVDVLKVDYDTSTDLKKKYGVTTQHTFVQVNSKGEMITKWLAGSVVELYKNIK